MNIENYATLASEIPIEDVQRLVDEDCNKLLAVVLNFNEMLKIFQVLYYWILSSAIKTLKS